MNAKGEAENPRNTMQQPVDKAAAVGLPIFGQSSSTNLQIKKSLGIFVEDLFFNLAG